MLNTHRLEGMDIPRVGTEVTALTILQFEEGGF